MMIPFGLKPAPDLNRLATDVASKRPIANIVCDDALFLPHRANSAGLNFREPHGRKAQEGRQARSQSQMGASSGAAGSGGAKNNRYRAARASDNLAGMSKLPD
jgi:hypothetical protein